MKKFALCAVLTFIGGVPTVFAEKLDEMTSPVTNPVNFEDPRPQTELRFIYKYHEFDESFVTQGGYAQLFALQARFAISDRLAIIATKDGIIDFRPDAVLPDDQGLANLAGGVKYAFYRNDEAGSIATLGVVYEAPTGDDDVLQGEGDGVLRTFLTAGAALEGINVMGSTGLRVPFDNDDSTFYDFDLHFDLPVQGFFFPGFDLNVIHVLDGGERLAIADEGADLFNLGASGATGKTMVTGAATARFRLCDSADIGLGYRFPLTSGNGSRAWDWRLTSDLQLRF